MSSTLKWKPTAAKGELSDPLKFKLREAYQLPRIFDEGDVQFLRGLAICNVKDADKLIELIQKHGSLEIFEEY